MPPEETKNTPPAGAPAGTPANGKEPGAGSASEEGQGRSKAWEAADQFKTENAKLKSELDAFKTKATKDEEERMAKAGEHEALANKRGSELEVARRELREERINNALIAAAMKRGIRDAGDLALVKLGDDVDGGDRGKLKDSAEAAVENLFKSKPYLFGTDNPKPNSAATGKQPAAGGSKPVDFSKVSAADVKTMDKDTFAEYRNWLRTSGTTFTR